MLCSVCKEKTAVTFVNKQGPDGKTELEGLCYDCAKKIWPRTESGVKESWSVDESNFIKNWINSTLTKRYKQ